MSWPPRPPLSTCRGVLLTIEYSYLYFGLNKLTNQKVLSWVASEPVHDFKGDLQPLLDEIFASDNADYPSKTDYLGYFAFGQEAYSSEANVTFSVPSLLVDLETS